MAEVRREIADVLASLDRGEISGVAIVVVDTLGTVQCANAHNGAYFNLIGALHHLATSMAVTKGEAS